MKITLTRAEGPVAECGTIVVGSYADADAVIAKWTKTAPEDGEGYDKVMVSVEWDDGENWSYRLDLSTGFAESFHYNLKSRLSVYAGKKCPAHLSPEKYTSMLSDIKRRCAGLCEQAEKLLSLHFSK